MGTAFCFSIELLVQTIQESFFMPGKICTLISDPTEREVSEYEQIQTG